MTPYDDFARYYDADVQSYTEDLMLYREMTRRTGDPIIELMCGSGRLLLPLAKEGYHITGVDISPTMLELAQKRAAEAKVTDKITLIQGDIRHVVLPAQHFALAFVALNSFMHLEKVKDQLTALETIRYTLQANGTLIIDLFNPDPAQLSSEDHRMTLERDYLLDGHRVFKFCMSESNMATQTSMMTWFYDELDEDGKLTRHVVRFAMRWFYRYELEHLLARAGFRLLSLYGSYNLEPYTSSSERIIAIASPRENGR